MTTIDLLPTLGELTADKAAKWVAALLAEAAALRAYEATYFPNSDEPREVAASERVHAAIRDWSRRARLMLDHAAAFEAGDAALPIVAELRAAVWDLEGVTCFSPESQARAIMQARRGEGVSREEVLEYMRGRRAERDRDQTRVVEESKFTRERPERAEATAVGSAA